VTHRQDVGEDGDDGGVEVEGEVFGLDVGDVHHLEGVGAGVAELVVRNLGSEWQKLFSFVT
jgi:hypothetical protein